jgi:hypothetical protein
VCRRIHWWYAGHAECSLNIAGSRVLCLTPSVVGSKVSAANHIMPQRDFAHMFIICSIVILTALQSQAHWICLHWNRYFEEAFLIWCVESIYQHKNIYK